MASFTAAVLLLATFAESLAAVRAIPRKRFYCTEGDLRDPHNVVCRAIRSGADADAATAEIARELEINHESAAAIGAALTPTFDKSDRVTTTDYDAAYTELAATLEREKNQLPILATMAQLAGRSEPFESAKDKFRALLPLVRAQPDPTRAAIEVSKASGHPHAADILLTDAFTRDRDNVDLIDAIAATSFDSLVTTAFGPIVFTRQGAHVRKRQTPLPTEKLYERARLQLHTLAQLGFADMVVSGFMALPAEVQERIVNPSEPHFDIRLDIAAAALITGKPELARTMSGALTPPPRGHDRRVGTRALVANALSDEKENPFDLIIAMFTSGATEFTSGVTGPLFISMLEESGYSSLAERIRRDVQRRFSFKRDDIPPEYAPHVQLLKTRIEAMYPPREVAPPNNLGDDPHVASSSGLGIENEILAAVFKKFAPTSKFFVIIEHGGNRAIVEVSQNMEGTTFLVTKTENGWEAKRISSWVS